MVTEAMLVLNSFGYASKTMSSFLFLPSHSFHILQPLELGIFGPLKSRYRQEIDSLVALDDAAPVKEQGFIQFYYRARKETFTPRILHSEWKAAGPFP